MNYYLLFKALHIIAVLSWVAGLLYLPRIFVYHSQCNPRSSTSKTFKVMEKKLLNYIMNPAMVASWLFGLLLIYSYGFNSLAFLWVQIKLTLVFLITAYHFLLIIMVKEFKNNKNKRSHKFYRFFNEIPTLLIIGIVFVIIFKPL